MDSAVTFSTDWGQCFTVRGDALHYAPVRRLLDFIRATSQTSHTSCSRTASHKLSPYLKALAEDLVEYGVWWRVGRSQQARPKAAVGRSWWLTTAAGIENVWKHLSDLSSNNIPSVEAETQDQNIDLWYENLAWKLQILHWGQRWKSAGAKGKVPPEMLLATPVKTVTQEQDLPPKVWSSY